MKPIIAILILLFLAWVFVVVPQRRRTRAHEAMQDDVETGDEIITAGGIHGIVREVEADDILRVEIAPGTIVRLDRRAVAAAAEEEPEPPAETADEPPPTPKTQTKPS